MPIRRFYVYILSSRSRTLYTGVTSNLYLRVFQHKNGLVEGFTNRYRIHRLVYYETHYNARTAIDREKEIKKWRREKKISLIEAGNATWEDLAAEWHG